MVKILSYPFRLAPNGTAVKVDQDSEQADREQIAVLALTIKGERPMQPGFGVTDPAFGGYLPAEIAAGVAEYGPQVEISGITTTPLTETTQVTEITFE